MIPDVFDERRKSEKEKSALAELFPPKEDLPDRIKLIGTFKGSPPTLPALYEARIIFDLLDMMDGKKEAENWKELNMSNFYEERSSALGGKHADRAVEIARAAPKPTELPPTWLERMAGKSK